MVLQGVGAPSDRIRDLDASPKAPHAALNSPPFGTHNSLLNADRGQFFSRTMMVLHIDEQAHTMFDHHMAM
jgi:hypothetical protein